MKYLIWLVIALAVVVWLQRANKTMRTAGDSTAGERKARGTFGRRGKEEPETMVQCAHCGIHFPASESVVDAAGVVFCSSEHLRLKSV
jgi:uncharacterized protein